MSNIENMINEEMVQDVIETVVEVQPTVSTVKTVGKYGVAALAGVAIWEVGKRVVTKVAKAIKAKKNAAEDVEVSEDQDVE